MKTPIADFLDSYAASGAVRMHMPGHKGAPGFDPSDITEIPGADSLYFADGIIKESEREAAKVFGTGATFYSTEGSSHCVRAMLRLAQLNAVSASLPMKILAGRNAHSSFVTGAGLLGFEVDWIFGESLLSCRVDPEELRSRLKKEKYACVYITSPDYPGNLADIAAIAGVCRENGALLAVDNAHGAYLRFTSPVLHPIALGADICCDSAHKTLPVPTGGAYLHIAKGREVLASAAKGALALFGSTSPSYVVLRALDEFNARAGDFAAGVAEICGRIDRAKELLKEKGFALAGDEPMKLTLSPKQYGYTGRGIDAFLRENGIFCDFADPDHVVLMPSPYNRPGDIEKLISVLSSLPRRKAIDSAPPAINKPEKALPLREALLAESEVLPAEECLGRICARPTVACPPAVPIAVCGELIDSATVAALGYYGERFCAVVK